MYYNDVINYPWVDNEADINRIVLHDTVVTANPNLSSAKHKIILLDAKEFNIINRMPNSLYTWGNCILWGDTTKLFISNYVGSRTDEFYDFFGIKRCINLSQTKRTRQGVDIDIYDSPEANIKKYFDKCVKYIKKHKRVLVYCMAGISRSATICIAYLMNMGLSLEKSMERMRRCRPIVNPNEGFMRQLREYEKELNQK